jgi:hypothetical protein
MPRFKIKDVVQINSVIMSSRTGQQGQIKQIIPNKQHTQTLDRYVVDFGKQDEETFWDIQLELVSPPAHQTGDDDKETP